MGWKAAIQMVGLVRGKPKAGQKHRANGKAILCEMGKERISNSDILDKNRSYMNTYKGVSDSGFDCWYYLKDRANNYKLAGKTKNGKDFEYSLRKDAVIGCALIFNPPEAVCCDWDVETYQKFYSDSWDFLKQTEPRLFRDENIILDAEHSDEGMNEDGKSKHLHRAIEARDKDDRYCGNLINARLLAIINKKYPAYMREHGWNMDDLDVTNWDRYKTDLEYRAERKQKAKENGLSVNRYGKKMSAREAKKQSLERVKFVEDAEALNAMKREHDVERSKFNIERLTFHDERKEMQQKLDEQKEALRQQQETLEQKRIQMQQELDEQKESLEREREALRQQKEALKQERELLRQERIQTQQSYSKRMREVNAFKTELKRTMDEVNAFAENDKLNVTAYGLETWCKAKCFQNGSIYDWYIADREKRKKSVHEMDDMVNRILSNGYNDTDYQK